MSDKKVVKEMTPSHESTITILGMNLYVFIGILVVILILAFLGYKFFIAKKDAPVTNNEPQSELDQVHAYYQQQLALQEKEYVSRLKQLQNLQSEVAMEEPEDRSVEVEDESDNRSVEVEDESDDEVDDEVDEEDEEEEEEEEEDSRSIEVEDDVSDEASDEASDEVVRIEIDTKKKDPQEVHVIRRGKLKGKELTDDEYLQKAAEFILP